MKVYARSVEGKVVSINVKDENENEVSLEELKAEINVWHRCRKLFKSAGHAITHPAFIVVK